MSSRHDTLVAAGKAVEYWEQEVHRRLVQYKHSIKLFNQTLKEYRRIRAEAEANLRKDFDADFPAIEYKEKTIE